MRLQSSEEEKRPQEVPPKSGRFYVGPAFLIAVTVLLITLFTVGIAYGVQTSAGSRGEVSEGVLVDSVREFRIQAQQWYYNPAILKANPGEKVRFVVTSQDIMHGFAINELGFNMQLSPGEQMAHEVDIPADMAEGYYTMYCSIFCGIGHPYMKGTLLIGNPGVEMSKFLPYFATLGLAGVFIGFSAIKRRTR
ncbi:MAG: hypothetical protein FJ014_18080 [Chloroflexi bacterium]|nr:hypothetical protein [Chloroflexota bacterium]